MYWNLPKRSITATVFVSGHDCGREARRGRGALHDDGGVHGNPRAQRELIHATHASGGRRAPISRSTRP